MCKICLHFREIKVPTKWRGLLSDHVHIWRKEYLRWKELGQEQDDHKGALPSRLSKAIWGHFLYIWRGGGVWWGRRQTISTQTTPPGSVNGGMCHVT